MRRSRSNLFGGLFCFVWGFTAFAAGIHILAQGHVVWTDNWAEDLDVTPETHPYRYCAALALCFGCGIVVFLLSLLGFRSFQRLRAGGPVSAYQSGWALCAGGLIGTFAVALVAWLTTHRLEALAYSPLGAPPGAILMFIFGVRQESPGSSGSPSAASSSVWDRDLDR